MSYNFIRKIRDGEFSLGEDVRQTLNDMIRLGNGVYRDIGLDKLVRVSERYLGNLDDENRFLVESLYATGLAMLILGIFEPKAREYYDEIALSSFCGFAHHFVMGRYHGRRQNHLSEQP